VRPDPTHLQVGERSETYSVTQIKEFATLRDQKLSEFYGYEQPAQTIVTPVFFGRVRVV
jgi:hypothetical protein